MVDRVARPGRMITHAGRALGTLLLGLAIGLAGEASADCQEDCEQRKKSGARHERDQALNNLPTCPECPVTGVDPESLAEFARCGQRRAECLANQKTQSDAIHGSYNQYTATEMQGECREECAGVDDCIEPTYVGSSCSGSSNNSTTCQIYSQISNPVCQGSSCRCNDPEGPGGEITPTWCRCSEKPYARCTPDNRPAGCFTCKCQCGENAADAPTPCD